MNEGQLIVPSHESECWNTTKYYNHLYHITSSKIDWITLYNNDDQLDSNGKVYENTALLLLLQHILRDVKFHLNSSFLGERHNFGELYHKLGSFIEVIAWHQTES